MVQITPLLQSLAVFAQAPPIVHYVSPNALAVRQFPPGDIPSGCQSLCQTVNNAMSNCTNQSCLCTSSIGTQLQACMNCFVAADPSSSALTVADSVIQGWNQGCNGSLTLTGGSTSSSTATASSSTSTATSSSSSPSTNKTGGAVDMKVATVAFGLVIAIACGIIIL